MAKISLYDFLEASVIYMDPTCSCGGKISLVWLDTEKGHESLCMTYFRCEVCETEFDLSIVFIESEEQYPKRERL